MSDTVLTKNTLDALPHIAEGKVRDLYEVDPETLLFVASDRISAYDVIMENVPPLLHLSCIFLGGWPYLLALNC